MHAIKAKTEDARLRNWTRMLKHAAWQTPAGEMYQGQYWSVIRGITETLTKRNTPHRLLIASAGLGWLTGKDQIPPYEATFQTGASDEIFSPESPPLERRGKIRQWWKDINQNLAGRKQFTDLGQAVTSDTRTIVCLLSSLYLEAVKIEIESIQEQRPDIQFLIFATEKEPARKTLKGWIPLESDLQKKLGGGSVSLSARMALEYFSSKRSTASITTSDCRSFFKRHCQKHGLKATFDRTPTTDEEAKQFIIKQMNNGTTNYTPALRAFRDAGFACEMKRFRGLFNEVKNHA
jgi:hypothetical protein